MIVYVPDKKHDVILLNWWEKLDRSGELHTTFLSSVHSPAAFLRQFQPPKALFFSLDDKGLCLAVWFEPFLTGAFMGLWVAPHRRKSPRIYKNIRRAFKLSFQHFNFLVGMTRHDKLLDPAERLGFKIFGKLPKAFDGDDAWTLVLTREVFDGRH